MLFVLVVFLLTVDVFLNRSVWLEHPLSMSESSRRKHLCAVCANTITFLPSQLFLSGASSYPGSHAHLKLPNVLTHLCSQPPLSGFRHSSSSVLMTQTLQLNGQGPKHQLLIELFCTCVCVPLKKFAAKPALFTVPSETNFIQRVLEVERISSGLS